MRPKTCLVALVQLALAGLMPGADANDEGNAIRLPPNVVTLTGKILSTKPHRENLRSRDETVDGHQPTSRHFSSLLEPDIFSLEKDINSFLSQLNSDEPPSFSKGKTDPSIAKIRNLEALYSSVELYGESGQTYRFYSLPGERSGAMSSSGILAEQDLEVIFSEHLEPDQFTSIYLPDHHERIYYYRATLDEKKDIFVRIDVNASGGPRRIAFYRARENFDYSPREQANKLPELGNAETPGDPIEDAKEIAKGDKLFFPLGENLGLGGVKLSSDELRVLYAKGSLIDMEPVKLGGELYHGGGNVNLGLHGYNTQLNIIYDVTGPEETFELQVPFSLYALDLSTSVGRVDDRLNEKKRTTLQHQVQINPTRTRLSIDAEKADDGKTDISTKVTQALDFSKEDVELAVRLTPEQIKDIADPEVTVNIKDKNSPLSLEFKSLGGGDGGGITLKWSH